MTLLLKSNIDLKVNSVIKGKIARVGGTVNQLLKYTDCTVEDINLLDGGYGSVAQKDHSKGFCNDLRYWKILAIQELKFLIRGRRSPRDRKTIVFDIYEAHEKSELHNKYDCSVSSNLLEHSANPIVLLLNFYFITKKGGHQYHAIPHYKYTFDMYRKPTTIEHLIADFENRTGADDRTHNEDYVQSAIERHGWQREFHKRYPVSYPYIHFHVFDEHNTRELTELMFEQVVVDVIKTDQFSDNVVLFENRLNARFLSKYRELIDQYSRTFLLDEVRKDEKCDWVRLLSDGKGLADPEGVD